MNKYIFLDIDGCLNTTNDLNRHRICGFHSRIFKNEPFEKNEFNFNEKCLNSFRNFINLYGDNVTIVISSNWRFNAAIDHFKDLFKLFDINIPNIDMIDNTMAESSIFKRSFIIAKYIDQKTKKYNDISFVCIDDRKDLYHLEYKDYLIYSNPDHGITDAMMDTIKWRLKL